MPRTKPATVDRFGRILIPRDVRRAVGLREGTEVEIVPDDRGVRLVPRHEGVLLTRVRGILVVVGEAAGDIAGAARRARETRVRRLSRRG